MGLRAFIKKDQTNPHGNHVYCQQCCRGCFCRRFATMPTSKPNPAMVELLNVGGSAVWMGIMTISRFHPYKNKSTMVIARNSMARSSPLSLSTSERRLWRNVFRGRNRRRHRLIFVEEMQQAFWFLRGMFLCRVFSRWHVLCGAFSRGKVCCLFFWRWFVSVWYIFALARFYVGFCAVGFWTGSLWGAGMLWCGGAFCCAGMFCCGGTLCCVGSFLLRWYFILPKSTLALYAWIWSWEKHWKNPWPSEPQTSEKCSALVDFAALLRFAVMVLPWYVLVFLRWCVLLCWYVFCAGTFCRAGISSWPSRHCL